jgi:hypothetical protein
VNTNELRAQLHAAATNVPNDRTIRDTVTARLSVRRRRQRSVALMGVVSAVLVAIVTTTLLVHGARQPESVANPAFSGVAVPSETTSQVSTIHKAVALSPDSNLVAFRQSNTASPVTIASGAPSENQWSIQTVGSDLFAYWLVSGTTPSITPSSSSGLTSKTSGPSIRHGYAITSALTDAPWSSPVALSRTDRQLTYRGHPATLTTYRQDGRVGRWLSWPLAGGEYIHAWADGVSQDAAIISFADTIAERPEAIDVHLTAHLTIKGLTRQTILADGANPQAITHDTIGLCPASAPTPSGIYSPTCLYLKAVSTYTTSGPCSDPQAAEVLVTIGGEKVTTCPSLQQATLYLPGQQLDAGQNIFVEAPPGGNLSAADLAALAVSAELTT